MADKQTSKKSDSPTYVVMNPRGLPSGVPIITIDSEDGQSQHFYEGDTYTGPRPEEFREEGVLVTPKQAEEIVEALDREVDADETEGAE
jgi:hypothetical protein